ncbi:hypothetical protein Natoc_3186 [Natronococcus occultus SP4]|uniref:Uncharacterized protein n=1 Tax=Natronococcus occultus SP4 TaxID=694430 RepID=L0K303_9EURY|nr:hypothetical protein Natoc_3186 [Natronococcus occultus SP4]
MSWNDVRADVSSSSSHVRPHSTVFEPVVAAIAASRASGGGWRVTPVEPMLAVAGTLSGAYLLAWWYWWDVLVDSGVELEYAE